MMAAVACARYEMRMQLRRWSMWVTTAVIVVLIPLISRGLVDDLFDADPKDAMVSAAVHVNLLLPIGYGCLLADRLVRDTRLRVAPILDTTPTSPAARLIGKYVGVCTAGALPIVATYFGLASVYVGTTGDLEAIAWAAAAFGAIVAPALLYVGALAQAVPLVMPAPLFRVLFVGYWFWSTINPAVMPTLSRTLLYPIGGYPIQALFHIGGPDQNFTWAGPQPGAVLNVLRPEPTPAMAWLSIGVLLVVAATALYAAHALRARATR
jgi:hypothetical protein